MIGWALEALAASGVLIALVLAARVPVRRAFGPTVAYALWAIPALRLLLPPVPAGWMPDAATPLAVARERVALLVLPEPVPDAGPPLLGLAIVAAWCVGAALVLGWQVVSYRRFAAGVAASGVPLGRVGRIALVVSDAVTDPLAYGLAYPVVAVPSDFRLRYGPVERELALAHEVAHHRRGDMVANWAALAVLALHWFNPLAWVAFRAFRADQEMANDAHVLAGCTPADRHAYACAIVKAAGCRTPAAACGLHTIEDLKGRLRMLTRPIGRGRLAAGAATVAVAALALLGATASGSEAATAVRRTVETTTGVPLDALTPTALLQTAGPDAPPAPPGPTGRGSGGRHVDAVREGRTTRVTVTENGRTRHFEGADAEAWLAAHPAPTPPAPPEPAARPVPPAPPAFPSTAEIEAEADRAATEAAAAERAAPRVVSRSCGGSGGATTLVRSEGGRQIITICTDRIEAARKQAERVQIAAIDQRRIARTAVATALASLRRTRDAMILNGGPRGLTSEQRARWLTGLADAIAEMERQTAERD